MRNGDIEGIDLPYTNVLWDWPGWSSPKRLGNRLDPFAPDFAANMEAANKETLIRGRNDPWILGWIFENENGWGYGTFDEMLGKDSDWPCKRAFISFLADHHDGDLTQVAETLGVAAESLDELADLPLDPQKISNELRGEFIRLASELYYRTLSELIKEYDPNHLFLGSALVFTGCPEWVEGSIPYVDVLSFNAYSHDASLHDGYNKYDKPRIIPEFGFSVLGRGLGGWDFAPDHKARGLVYRHFVEQVAAHPYIIGLGYFKAFDDFPDIGFQPAENFNMGVVNTCDQPYHEMVEQVKIANERVYDIRTGKAEPVTKEELGL